GAGIIFNNDNTGDSRFRTTVLNVVGSYAIPFKKDSNQRITVGVQTGITNKTLSYDELRFDAQYNGISYDNGLPTREAFTANSQNFFNLHAGISYDNQISQRKKLSIGASLFNITKPKESYFDNQAIRVDRRFSGFASYQFPVHEKIDVIPAAFYMQQGRYFEFIVGARGKYILSESVGARQSAYLGVFFRTKDAGFITAEYDYNNWHFGLSYDINLSSLRQASNGRGGIELSAIYILKLFKPKRYKHIICPDYI
ncbi:MAG: PorP/SprF family type IX secretion system membrane protein, partial [Flavobacteriales bacterium]